MGRDIQDLKSDNRDLRSQLKKNFQAIKGSATEEESAK